MGKKWKLSIVTWSEIQVFLGPLGPFYKAIQTLDTFERFNIKIFSAVASTVKDSREYAKIGE